MNYKMNLHCRPYQRIDSGLKVVEMRLNTPERKKIKVGDTIEFTNRDTNEVLKVEVINLKSFPTFKELYEAYPKEKLGYLKDEEANYRDMNEYYSDIDITSNGVLAIEIRKTST